MTNNLFKFDDKLNDFKKIGFALSGGLDSALLLYYLIKYTNYEITCITCFEDINPTNIQPAKEIVQLISKKINKNIKNHIFKEYTKKSPKDKQKRLEEIFINLYDSSVIDCCISGTNKNLENIEDSSNEKDVSRDYQKKWVNWVYKPIIDKDKIWIKNHYEKNNLIESLLPLTVSCISIKDIPCKKCYWCKEKYTTFGIY